MQLQVMGNGTKLITSKRWILVEWVTERDELGVRIRVVPVLRHGPFASYKVALAMRDKINNRVENVGSRGRTDDVRLKANVPPWWWQ